MPKSDPRPAVIDLFSGVGGLSLGAARAGFRVAASVELDPIASKSHADNFPTTRHFEVDVSRLDGAKLLFDTGLQRGQLSGLIGGPPCQGFSFIGRRDAQDPRNELFAHFFRLVGEMRPHFFVAENVPGILTPGYEPMIEAALSLVPKNYAILEPIRIKASDYGAPTIRTRIFFIGYDTDAMDPFTQDDFLPGDEVETVNVEMALRGLRNVRDDWQTEEQSWRTVNELPKGQFYKNVVDHVPLGVGNARALAALKNERKASGFLGTKHDPRTVARFALLEHGEIDTVYRSPRLNPKGFCPTLRAGTASDRGSRQALRPIHPTHPRVITPREGARLQGFPDWFVFNPTKWHSFRQIGNSVSPLVAEAILSKFADTLNDNP